MNDLALAGAQARYALRGFLRNWQFLVFVVVMPLFLLMLFNSIFHGSKGFLGTGIAAGPYYTAAVVSY
ncbi:MAG: hypothetical protein ACYCV7_17695, partial [Acidimicrobiales bacterium]